jgi:peptide subunit release factor 1 (eRF1)
MELTYTCPHCGEECEAYAESAEEIEVWCENCQEDITDYFDVYADYIGFMTDRAMDYYGDR